MGLASAFTILFALLTLSCAAPANVAPVVDLGYAKYQGALNATTDITTFIGIRYAAPPTGKLRFQAPHAPAHVSGVQIANTEAPTCFQAAAGAAATTPFGKRAVTADEDCLFLNVFLPGQLTVGAKLPVVVWIHGGGYVGGSTSGLDGGDLIRDAEGGVISVLIQYRLGAFGFLAGKEVKANGALNAGLLDQQFALQWVQQHIASFGGDPTKVAIWGQSAGAGSVLQHVVANGGKTSPPLFRVALTSSTFLPSQFNFDDPIPENIFTTVVNETGCATARNAFTCLQGVDAGLLSTVNANFAMADFSGVFLFVPVVDGSFIVERPTQTLLSGTVNGEVALSVTNTFEGRDFVATVATAGKTLAQYVANLFPTFSTAQINAVVQAYSNIGLSTVEDQAIGIMGESIFICPTYVFLGAFPGRSHKGLFAIPPGNHGDDLPFYYPSQSAPDFNNTAFIKSFSQSFLAVVKSLDLNATPDPSNITPSWNVFAAGNTEMLFNRTQAAQPQPNIHAFSTDAGLLKRCSLWDELAPSTPQ